MRRGRRPSPLRSFPVPLREPPAEPSRRWPLRSGRERAGGGGAAERRAGRSEARTGRARPASGRPSRPPRPPRPLLPGSGDPAAAADSGESDARSAAGARGGRRVRVRGRGADACEPGGGEQPRGPRAGLGVRGVRSTGGCLVGGEDQLPPAEGDSGAGASPPGTELPAAGSAGAASAARRTRTVRRGVAFQGRIGSLGPAGSSCSRERPSGRTGSLPTAVPVVSLAGSPPHLISGYRLCDFSVVLLGVLMGSGSTPRGRSAKQKRKQVGRRMTPGALCPEISRGIGHQEPGGLKWGGRGSEDPHLGRILSLLEFSLPGHLHKLLLRILLIKRFRTEP